MIKGVIFDLSRTLYDPDKKELVEGALFVLKELKRRKYRMCLVSKNKESANYAVKKYNLSGFFNEVVVSKEKSEKDFVKCLNAMQITHKEAMVVGDKIKGEIKIGNSLGMATVWFRNGKYENEMPEEELEKPKYIITNLRDILKLI